jgi:hypothetical protein
MLSVQLCFSYMMYQVSCHIKLAKETGTSRTYACRQDVLRPSQGSTRVEACYCGVEACCCGLSQPSCGHEESFGAVWPVRYCL